MWPSRPLCWPVAIGPAGKARSAPHWPTYRSRSNDCWLKFSRRCMTRRSRSAKPTRKTRRPMRTLKKRSRRVSLFPIGVAGENAKRKSRKKPAPLCVVSPWSDLVVRAFAFTAAKQPQSAPYLPALIDTLRFPRPFETVLPYCSPGTHRDARARHPGWASFSVKIREITLHFCWPSFCHRSALGEALSVPDGQAASVPRPRTTRVGEVQGYRLHGDYRFRDILCRPPASAVYRGISTLRYNARTSALRSGKPLLGRANSRRH